MCKSGKTNLNFACQQGNITIQGHLFIFTKVQYICSIYIIFTSAWYPVSSLSFCPTVLALYVVSCPEGRKFTSLGLRLLSHDTAGWTDTPVLHDPPPFFLYLLSAHVGYHTLIVFSSLVTSLPWLHTGRLQHGCTGITGAETLWHLVEFFFGRRLFWP